MAKSKPRTKTSKTKVANNYGKIDEVTLAKYRAQSSPKHRVGLVQDLDSSI